MNARQRVLDRNVGDRHEDARSVANFSKQAERVMSDDKQQVKTLMDRKEGPLDKDARVVENEEEAAILLQMRKENFP